MLCKLTFGEIMGKPYVISAELELVGDDIIRREKIEAFRRDLTEDLTVMGKDVTWIEAEELVVGINDLIEQESLPIIAIDGRYVRPELITGRLELSRSVDKQGED